MANVLVVDDEEDILETIPDVLRKWGHNPIIAKNGKEGLAKFKEYPVDFVITDMKMPEMDGLTLLEKIQQLEKQALVILLTGYPSLDSAVTAMRNGAFDYLVKPVNMDELKLRIERGLERKEHIKSLPFLKGLNWAIIVSIPLWLILGIILASLLK